MVQDKNKKEWSSSFIENIFQICQKDSGIAASLKRAGSENQSAASWGVLVKYGVDIEKEYKRIPCSIVAELIAKSKLTEDLGQYNLGRVLKLSIQEKKSDQEDINDSRLRRILNCNTLDELESIIRPTINFIISRGYINKLNINEFLKDLLFFDIDDAQLRTKKKWAKYFYLNDKQAGDDSKDE